MMFDSRAFFMQFTLAMQRFKIGDIPRVTFSICARGPAALSSKEQPLSPNSRFWRESPGPQAPPESVNPSKAKKVLSQNFESSRYVQTRQEVVTWEDQA
jgi:hypothetical protein